MDNVVLFISNPFKQREALRYRPPPHFVFSGLNSVLTIIIITISSSQHSEQHSSQWWGGALSATGSGSRPAGACPASGLRSVRVERLVTLRHLSEKESECAGNSQGGEASLLACPHVLSTSVGPWLLVMSHKCFTTTWKLYLNTKREQLPHVMRLSIKTAQQLHSRLLLWVDWAWTRNYSRYMVIIMALLDGCDQLAAIAIYYWKLLTKLIEMWQVSDLSSPSSVDSTKHWYIDRGNYLNPVNHQPFSLLFTSLT